MQNSAEHNDSIESSVKISKNEIQPTKNDWGNWRVARRMEIWIHNTCVDHNNWVL